MPFLQARHPNRLASEHTLLVEDLIEIAESGWQEAVDAIIEMLADFHVFGTNSRFAEKMKNLPIWELKTRTRGGLKGVFAPLAAPTHIARLTATELAALGFCVANMLVAYGTFAEALVHLEEAGRAL